MFDTNNVNNETKAVVKNYIDNLLESYSHQLTVANCDRKTTMHIHANLESVIKEWGLNYIDTYRRMDYLKRGYYKK